MEEKEWWEDVDTRTMDYVELSYFEDSMTSEEYARYLRRETE